MILSQQCNEPGTSNITILPIRDVWPKSLSKLPKAIQFRSDAARILSILTLKSQPQSHIFSRCSVLLSPPTAIPQQDPSEIIHPFLQATVSEKWKYSYLGISLSWLLSLAPRFGQYHTSLSEMAVLSISSLNAIENCFPFSSKNLPWEKYSHFSFRVLSFRHD